MATLQPLAILCTAGDYRHFQSLSALASTCASSNRNCHVMLSHEALYWFLMGDLSQTPGGYLTPWAEILEQAREHERITDPLDLLTRARESGRVKVYGCSSSIAQARSYTAEQLKRLDGIVGHTTFLQWASEWQLVTL